MDDMDFDALDNVDFDALESKVSAKQAAVDKKAEEEREELLKDSNLCESGSCTI